MFFIKKYLATVFLAVAFYLHFFLPHPEKDVQLLQVERTSVQRQITIANDSINTLAKELANNSIARYRFNFEVTQQLQDLKSLEKTYTTVDSKYQETKKANKDKYFGYPSRYKFVWSLALGIVITILAHGILKNSFTIKEKSNRIAELAKGLMGLSIGGYFFAWVFYPANDLPKSTYLSILVSMGIVAAIALYYISKIRYKSKQDLKDKNAALEGLVKGFAEVRKAKSKSKN